ncbi:MAG: flagellin [Alphaproteobacteria bacterium]|nr:flagellin [Alphaproteobacteria bacterium]
MAIGDISLGTAARANLLSLQNTSKLLGQTQERLATGRKVNSSLDNASAYFTSKGFLDNANDLAALKDGMSTAIKTVEAASKTIDAITSVVQQMQGLLNQAMQNGDAAARATLATSYAALATQLDGLVDDATFNGINLLKSTDTLTVNFNATGTTSLSITGINSDSTTLAIDTATNSWALAADMQADQVLLKTALTTLRTTAASLGANNTLLQTRQEYTNSIITTLQTASDNLILADTNEEGANLQALQAQSALGIVALGISGQQAQAILRLF